MASASALPTIIQGGMGAGVSNWRLARAVASEGQLGVVSGTALDVILARRLQLGDQGGHMRRALERFPMPGVADRILDRYFIAGGKAAARPFVPVPTHTKEPPRDLVELTIAANFVEVWLAREGHCGQVGINYLEKIQLPHLPSLYGALLAGVDCILMGAGIPVRIPAVLDGLARHERVEYPLHVSGALDDDDTTARFDPGAFVDLPQPPLKRPAFLAIVSSHVLAATLLKRSTGEVDGFVVEGPTAGGHNAPPRGKLQLNDAGEPIYGDRDLVDLAKLRALGKPFWLAGGYGSPAGLAHAREEGAAGIQVGTAFAFCDESGLRADYRAALIAAAVAGTAGVFTDPLASPTSFPFKVASLPGTMSEPAVYADRVRVCDLGYLREAYRTESGDIGFRCPAEPMGAWCSKGGAAEETSGRKCICNALLATVGLGQVRGRTIEPGIVTSGDDLAGITRFLPSGRSSYTAADVVDQLLHGLPSRPATHTGSQLQPCGP